MFDWPGKELILEFPELEENIKLSLLGKEGNLEYKHENGKLHIDLSNIYHNDLPCEHAWTIKIQNK